VYNLEVLFRVRVLGLSLLLLCTIVVQALSPATPLSLLRVIMVKAIIGADSRVRFVVVVA
jgi:hypothetical protein